MRSTKKAGHCCLLALVACVCSIRGATQERAGQADAPPAVVRLRQTLAAGSVEGFSVSPTDQLVALNYEDHYIKIWNALTGEFQRTLPRFKDVPAISWSPDGRQLLLYEFFGKTASVWDVQTGTQLCALKGLRHDLDGAQWSPDGRLILTKAQDDGFKASWLNKEETELQFWDAATCQPRTLLKIGGMLVEAQISPDGQQLLTYGYYQEAKLWDVQTGRLQATLRPDKTYYRGDSTPRAEFLPGGKLVVVYNSFRGVSVWDAATGELQGTAVTEAERRSSNSGDYVLRGVSPDGRFLVIYRQRFKSLKSFKEISTIELRESLTGSIWAELSGRNMMSAADQVVWSPDGQTLVTAGGSHEYNGKIWDVTTGELKATFPMIAKEGHVPFTSYWADLDHLSFHPRLPILVASSNHLIRFWNPMTGELFQQLDGSTAATWSAGGQLLFTLNREQKALQVWELVRK